MVAPRSYPRTVRSIEPYHFQRDRQIFNKQPRPSQPNISQPNQKPAPTIWGGSMRDYWNAVSDDYFKRRKTLAQSTALSLGRI